MPSSIYVDVLSLGIKNNLSAIPGARSDSGEKEQLLVRRAHAMKLIRLIGDEISVRAHSFAIAAGKDSRALEYSEHYGGMAGMRRNLLTGSETKHDKAHVVGIELPLSPAGSDVPRRRSAPLRLDRLPS
jgi:hypothetical protein